MRTIKFRAQDIASNKWLYGDLRHHKDDVCIFEQGGTKGEQVKRDTIGQFVGLKDKNGTEIYEGDIFRLNDHHIRYVVEYEEGVFHGKQIGSSSYVGLPYWLKDVVIVGNKYDNPELLKK